MGLNINYPKLVRDLENFNFYYDMVCNQMANLFNIKTFKTDCEH